MGHLTALEFYSGIGGMHCALKLADLTAAVLDAFDINHSANKCYQHNFGKPPKQVKVA
jgi:tRNA (cytosine38-C5)-methyltransferase